MVGKAPVTTLPEARGWRIGVVCASFHEALSEKLLEGALQVLERAGVGEGDRMVLRVPGSFELPFATQELILRWQPLGVVALGVVIRGGTPHFHYVSRAATEGILQVSLKTRTPVTMGILTCDTFEQALARCGGSEGNKGAEAAQALLHLLARLRELPRREGGDLEARS